MNPNAGDILAGIFLLALLYVLVRPQSKAAELVEAFTSLFTAIVKRATDLG